MFSPLLFPRAKLDLGIVKKSIVVDDVSKKYSTTDTVIKKMSGFFLTAYLWISVQWFTLKDTQSGRVHFRLEWLALLPNSDRLEQVWAQTFLLLSHIFLHFLFFFESSTLRYLLQIIQKNQSVTSKTADPPSSAILVVYLDKAEALPVSQISLPSVLRFVPAQCSEFRSLCVCG